MIDNTKLKKTRQSILSSLFTYDDSSILFYLFTKYMVSIKVDFNLVNYNIDDFNTAYIITMNKGLTITINV